MTPGANSWFLPERPYLAAVLVQEASGGRAKRVGYPRRHLGMGEVGRLPELGLGGRNVYLRIRTVPMPVMHGDDDQIVPYEDSAPLSAKLLQNGELKTSGGFPHGMPTTPAEAINADLLDFFKARPPRRRRPLAAP